jgi:hypothetical protein
MSSLFGITLWPPFTFGSTVPSSGIVRDWDILQEIMVLLDATRAFDGVFASDPPENRGRKAEYKSLVIVSPMKGDERNEGWDDPTQTQWLRTVTWGLTIIARDSDPLKRDRLAERLLNIAKRAVNADISILNTTIIGRTHIYEDKYLDAIPPTRTIQAIGEFAYFTNGPNGYGIEP